MAPDAVAAVDGRALGLERGEVACRDGRRRERGDEGRQGGDAHHAAAAVRDEATEGLKEAERQAVDDVGHRGDAGRHQLEHVRPPDEQRLQPGDDDVEVDDPHEQAVGRPEPDLERGRAGTKRFTSTLKTAPAAAPIEKCTVATSMKKSSWSVVSAPGRGT